jgi:hypothetical protein
MFAPDYSPWWSYDPKWILFGPLVCYYPYLDFVSYVVLPRSKEK